MPVLSALLFVALAHADDEDPWNTGAPTWPPEPDPAPAPAPEPTPAPTPAPTVAPAPVAVAAVDGEVNQCGTPKRTPGTAPLFTDVAIAGQAGITGGLASTAGGSGGAAIGVELKVDCTRMSLAIGAGNLVAFAGDGATDFSRAVLGLGADSAVLAWRSRTDIGKGHGFHGGAGFDTAFFASSSTWTDSRDAITEATGVTSATVWIGGAELGLDHTWNPSFTTEEPLDVRISIEGGATARFILDDPETHYAGWSLAYSGDSPDVILLAGAYVRPSVRVGNFEPYLDASWLFGEDIPGLSGLRLVAGTRIDGNLFKVGTTPSRTRTGVVPAQRAPTDNLF